MWLEALKEGITEWGLVLIRPRLKLFYQCKAVITCWDPTELSAA
jgi:hypothetical protein